MDSLYLIFILIFLTPPLVTVWGWGQLSLQEKLEAWAQERVTREMGNNARSRGRGR